MVWCTCVGAGGVASYVSFLLQKLRQLLFGSAKKSFSAEWKRQNLVFSSVPGLAYGLVQHKVSGKTYMCNMLTSCCKV